MIILSNNRQLDRVIKHIRQSLSSKEPSANERILRGIPKGVVLLFELGDKACLKVSLRHILNNIIPIGQLIDIPPIGIASLPVNNLNLNAPLLHINLSILALGVKKHHLDTHGDVPLELLGDEVELDALGEGLEQFLLKVVLLLDLLLLLGLRIVDGLLLGLDLGL